jgi:hypothetical protein
MLLKDVPLKTGNNKIKLLYGKVKFNFDSTLIEIL